MSAQPDRVTLKSATPAPPAPLTVGHPVQFHVTVTYTLSSHKVAILALYIEMFQKRGCTGGVHGTTGGASANLVRGTGTRTIVVTWPGTAPKQLGTPGSLSFGANLWMTNRQELKAFGILNPRQYCYPLS